MGNNFGCICRCIHNPVVIKRVVSPYDGLYMSVKYDIFGFRLMKMKAQKHAYTLNIII